MASADDPIIYKTLLFLGMNVAFFAWLVMLAAGGLWHTFDIGSPISFNASLPVGLGLLLVAFFVFRHRSQSQAETDLIATDT